MLGAVEHGGDRVEVALPGRGGRHVDRHPRTHGTAGVTRLDEGAGPGRGPQAALAGEAADQPQLPVRRQRLDHPQPVALGQKAVEAQRDHAATLRATVTARASPRRVHGEVRGISGLFPPCKRAALRLEPVRTRYRPWR
nr:hypothetical protein GCM10020092_054680 [Actinoplanes digitatis]